MNINSQFLGKLNYKKYFKYKIKTNIKIILIYVIERINKTHLKKINIYKKIYI